MKLLFHLHGIPSTLPAGAEVHAYTTAKFLASQGHEVTIIVTPPKTNKLAESQSWKDGMTILIHASEKELDTHYDDSDAVITHLDETRNVINRAKRFNLPVVHLVHNSGQLAKYQVKHDEAALIAYNSISTAKEVRFLNVPSILLQPHVSVKEYQTDLTKPRDKFTIVNLNHNKGGHVFWTLANNHPERSWLCKVGGYGQQLIDYDYIPDNVTTSPCNTNMLEIYSQTHALIMPSQHETYGRVALEACCSGIPVIASPTPGLIEALGKENALWANPNDIMEWETAIKALENPETYMHYSQFALQRAIHQEQVTETQLINFEIALNSVIHNNRKRVYGFVSEPHYIDHMSPVLHSLPPEATGTVTLHNVTDELEERAYRHNLMVNYGPLTVFPNTTGSIVLVSSWRDQCHAQSNNNIHGSVRGCLVRMEAGSGQTYVDPSGSPQFIGGNGHENLRAVLVPGQVAGTAVKNRSPNLPVAGIGCPKLDWWPFWKNHADPKVIAVSFHHDLEHLRDNIPETGGAFKVFHNEIVDLITQGDYTIMGTNHPHFNLKAWWGKHYCPDFEEILDKAGMLIVDNSSVAFEWLLAHRKHPLVLMNDPKYRSFMDHGQRFWDLAKQIDVVTFNPGEITVQALEQLPQLIDNRIPEDYEHNLIDSVYAVPVGLSTITARESLLELLGPIQVDGDVQVRFLRSVTGQNNQLHQRGTTMWMTREKAEPLLNNKHLEIISRNNPEPLPTRDYCYGERLGWNVVNFARYHQLTYARNNYGNH